MQMSRPPLTALGWRRAKPLHCTLPTWAREPMGEGRLQWRMYRRHRFGSTLYMVFDAGSDMTRAEVAKKLREFRKVLFGRDKLEDEAVPSSPELQPITRTTPVSAEQYAGQPSLF